jgi:TolB-like protein
MSKNKYCEIKDTMKKKIKWIALIPLFSLLLSCETGGGFLKRESVMDLKISDSKKKVISVMKFDDRSIGTKRYKPWRMGIPDMIMEALGAIPYYKVISREYITKQVLKEQEFQLLGATDQESAVKLGNLLNAQYIVIGSFQVFRNTLQIRSKVVSVKTGEMVKQTSAAGKLDNFFTLQNQIAVNISTAMNLRLTEDAKKKLIKKYDTKVLDASLANYRGEQKLEKIEVLKKRKKKKELKKVKEEAKKDFKEAIKLDTNYEKAKKNLAKIGLGIPVTL